MDDQLAVVLENDQLSVRVLEPSDVATVQALDLIAILGVHDHILVAVLKHEETLSEPANSPFP